MEIATFILAVWGAAVSTVLAARTIIRDRAASRFGLTMRVSYKSAAPEVGEDAPTVALLLVNEGSRPVRIDDISIEWPGTQARTSIRLNELPRKLESDEHYAASFPLDAGIVEPDLVPFERVTVGYSGSKLVYEPGEAEQYAMAAFIDIALRLKGDAGHPTDAASIEPPHP